MSSFEQHLQQLTDATQPSGVRRTAIANLVEQGDAKAVPFLVDALADSDSTVRREATKALQQLNAATAIEPLIDALKREPNDLTAWAMMEALAELGTLRVLPALQAFQNVDSLLTRMEAAKNIARLEARFPDGEPVYQEVEPSERTQEPDTEETVTEEAVTEETVLPEEEIGLPEEEELETLEQEDTAEYIEMVFAPDTDTELPELDFEIADEAAPEVTETTERRVDFAEDEQQPEEITQETRTAEPEEENTPPDADVYLYDEGVENLSDEPVRVDTEIVEPEGLEEELEEEGELEELSESISHASRLVGQPVTLPVLAPSAPAVWHSAIGYGAPPEPPRPNVFALLLQPSSYLSKRWVSRTRVYLLLWCTLIAATLGLVRFQGRSGMEISQLTRMGISGASASEQVRRSLAEGDFYMQEGYYRQAINSYELGQRLGLVPIEFYKKLGDAYLKEHQYALAVEAYEFFIAAQPVDTREPFVAEASVREPWQPDYRTYNALGTGYLKLGRVGEARAAFAQAIALTPNDGQAYHNLARLYANLSAVSVRAISAAATNSLHGSEGISDTANRYCQKLRFAEAVAARAVTLNPDVAAYHATLGWIVAKRGHTQRAINTLSRAIRLQSDYVDAHYHLALVALKANKREKALEAIRNVLKLKPAFVHLHFRS
ncbi:hypothetical protein C6495_04500 [Candidatus Poribacteria bacterium]|nr:MAG: hypothetical protein C6495_04500 [Candidatus Poribacteria bacterium]